ncbi:YhgE/Pip domain-containing protein [Actinomadura rudentiformis]|uniref:YhgE/Pip domain-containing protein n=1 Tax=Actinomadura rudentiformis TaxID=359158 RepID=A0A6H9ZAR0_9ACTN|nr:YhgE/Pip domain-containing protein [Actinomadura rudentiformis]KAB2351422.1 YhgE/Pip domain-containing protein [Actinomadura rudentiformis]
MRLPALTSGVLELRRFRRNRLTRIAVAGLVLLPLLYAGLYLWSFWDPYARLSHVPVALVVDDKPAKADGKTVHAGADLADELKKRKVFDWHTVGRDAAEDGVRSGKYYMALTIPSDFSSRIASPSGSGAPQAAALKLQLNDANNYVVGTVAQAAFKEVSTAAGSDAVRGYFDQIFVSFGKLHGELDKAADGAGQLADGSGKAHDGAGKLAGGLGKAHSAGEQLTSGLGTLHDGTGELADGSRQVSAGMGQLTATVDKAADAVVPLLRENAPQIRSAALLVAKGADRLADAAGTLPAQSREAVRDAEAAQAELDRYLDAHPEIPPNVRHRLTQAADQVVSVARQVDRYVQAHTADLKKLAADARKAERLARKVAANAPTLAGKVEAARRNVDRLNDGARQVASGAARIDAGTGKAFTGTSKLTSGLGQLSEGAVTLDTALLQISEGSGELAHGLKDGAKQVPAYGKGERNDRADMMSSPVRLASSTDNKVPNYGTGFAPFFMPLALWVGGMVIYMMLRPLNPRALAGTAPGWRVALAGWLPAAAIGVAQAGVVLAVLHFGLGLEAEHWLGLIAFLSLASAAFLAVIQWVNARFGPVGRILALALLMLQLTSAAGTYPIETSPGFFQAIQPFLPMPWVVTAVRHLISGGGLAPVWQGGAVLVAFLVGGLALTALTVRHNRVWTIKRLHPVLKL